MHTYKQFIAWKLHKIIDLQKSIEKCKPVFKYKIKLVRERCLAEKIVDRSKAMMNRQYIIYLL